MSERERLLSFLFDRDDRTLVNMKFFRGERDLVSADEFCAQAHSALMQKRMGKARVSEWLELTVNRIDVRKFVAAL